MTALETGLRLIPVIQGEHRVAGDPADVLTTVLGSCVSICLHDPEARVGGMNHFLLPGEQGRTRGETRYGINAMEVLINALLKAGARSSRLQAKVFGGANATASRLPIGRLNAEFAFWFLRQEGIPCIGQDVGGVQARRLRFWPHSGQARQMLLPLPAAKLTRPATPPAPATAGEPDLFL